MSVFTREIGTPEPIAVRITGNTATTIVDASDSAFWVPWFEVNEINGGTQNLTVDLYDGSNAHYLGDDAGMTWAASAVTADKSYRFSGGYIVPKGWKLRVTSSDAAGYFHVHGLKARVL